MNHSFTKLICYHTKQLLGPHLFVWPDNKENVLLRAQLQLVQMCTSHSTSKVQMMREGVLNLHVQSYMSRESYMNDLVKRQQGEK